MLVELQFQDFIKSFTGLTRVLVLVVEDSFSPVIFSPRENG